MNWKELFKSPKKIALIISIILIIGVILFMALSYIYEIDGSSPSEARYATADATCVQYAQLNCENKEVEIAGEKFFCAYGFLYTVSKQTHYEF